MKKKKNTQKFDLKRLFKIIEKEFPDIQSDGYTCSDAIEEFEGFYPHPSIPLCGLSVKFSRKDITTEKSFYYSSFSLKVKEDPDEILKNYFNIQGIFATFLMHLKTSIPNLYDGKASYSLGFLSLSVEFFNDWRTILRVMQLWKYTMKI